jgi:aminoglycoside phosphotransferase (APT) family kinase protein
VNSIGRDDPSELIGPPLKTFIRAIVMTTIITVRNRALAGRFKGELASLKEFLSLYAEGEERVALAAVRLGPNSTRQQAVVPVPILARSATGHPST